MGQPQRPGFRVHLDLDGRQRAREVGAQRGWWLLQGGTSLAALLGGQACAAALGLRVFELVPRRGSGFKPAVGVQPSVLLGDSERADEHVSLGGYVEDVDRLRLELGVGLHLEAQLAQQRLALGETRPLLHSQGYRHRDRDGLATSARGEGAGRGRGARSETAHHCVLGASAFWMAKTKPLSQLCDCVMRLGLSTLASGLVTASPSRTL